MVTPEIVAPIPVEAPLPSLKYPVDFLPPNTGIGMHNPDTKGPENTVPPAAPTIPVEKLIESMRPELPLQIDSAKEGFGAASMGPTTTAAPPAGAPQ
jgi:pilus assembly protein CpaC